MFIIIGVYEIYVKLQGPHTVYRISPQERWAGIIDMDYDHGVDVNRILKGEDVLLVVDYANPLFRGIVQKTILDKPLMALAEFEIGDFDTNGDGVLNQEDDIYRYLHILYFNPNGQGYYIKNLPASGIRGIQIKHLTTHGNHKVIMSDGSTRTLYEIHQPGGVAIYKNSAGKIITNLPQKITSP